MSSDTESNGVRDATIEVEPSPGDRELLELIAELDASGDHASADYYRQHLAAGQAIERGDYRGAERILGRRLVGRVYVAPSRDVVRWAPVHRFASPRRGKPRSRARARRERCHVARATSSADPGDDGDPEPGPRTAALLEGVRR
jgi:hypothetical protein